MKRMLIEKLDVDLKKALADRLEGWELVEFLQVPVEEIIELLEDEVLANLPDVLEFARIDTNNDNESKDTEYYGDTSEY